MSSFLGPIHFWLYNKVKFQEELTFYLYTFAVDNNIVADDAEISSLVKKQLRPLDELIDAMNIHSWLQDCIHNAENRYAKLIVKLTDKNDNFPEFEKATFKFGKLHNVGQVSVRDAYRIFDDSFLNGMPCDRVNVITDQDDFRISWEQTQDIHGSYWNNAGGSPELYYNLRKQVMLGMLEDSGLSLESHDYLHYSIISNKKIF